jgi:hypothetical protein
MSASTLEELLARHVVEFPATASDWTHCHTVTGLRYRFVARSSSEEQLHRLLGKQMAETGKPPQLIPRLRLPSALAQEFVSDHVDVVSTPAGGYESSAKPRVKYSDMLNEYRKTTGDWETSPAQFSAKLQHLGLQTVRSHGIRYWEGVRLVNGAASSCSDSDTCGISSGSPRQGPGVEMTIDP